MATPTSIIAIAQMQPEVLRQATQKLKREIEELEAHPDKATKIREVAAMAPRAPGDDPTASGDTPDSHTLRTLLATSQEHGKAEGKAITKFQMTLMGLAITLLWSVTMGFATNLWNKQEARVTKVEETTQILLQQNNGKDVRDADVIRRLDKVETKQDAMKDQVNEVLLEVRSLKK